jgi:hypothetical protein
LSQLFGHLGFLGEVHLGRSLGYIDDDELMSILYRHRAKLLARLQGTPPQALQSIEAATSVSGSLELPDAASTTEL